ncbi:MAG: hypothetical protein HYY36_05695, partial [Gammaproteobacteria bacterium]|nr:hypothetical protein [Gammaproteobacteria bacterium]
STTLAARGGLRYGYGLGSYAWLHRGVLFHGHGGDADGYLSRLGYSRERGLGYFVVINVFRKRDLDRIQRIIEEYIATGIDVPEPPVHGPGAHLLSRYAGEYQAATSRFQDMDERAQGTASIRVAGTTLIIERDGSSRSLIPVNDRHFRYQGETVATSAFVMDGGSLYFQDESGNYVKVDGGRW